jgi:hypothetical protein
MSADVLASSELMDSLLAVIRLKNIDNLSEIVCNVSETVSQLQYLEVIATSDMTAIPTIRIEATAISGLVFSINSDSCIRLGAFCAMASGYASFSMEYMILSLRKWLSFLNIEQENIFSKTEI